MPTVVDAKTAADAKAKLAADRFDLVLVNRVLAADGTQGMDVIQHVIDSKNAPPVMLVSDHETRRRKQFRRARCADLGNR